VDERELHLVALQLLQRLGERLERPVHVGLEDEVEGGGLTPLDLLEDVLQAHARTDDRAGSGEAGVAVALLPRLGDQARRLVVGGDSEVLARVRHAREAEHLHRRRGQCLLDLVAAVVEQGAHAAPRGAGDDRVAHPQGAALDEHGGHGAAAHVEVGLEDDAARRRLGVGRQLLDIGDEQELLE